MSLRPSGKIKFAFQFEFLFPVLPFDLGDKILHFYMYFCWKK